MNIKTTPINMSLYILSTQFSTGGTRCWVGTNVILHSHCSSVSPSALKNINNDSSHGLLPSSNTHLNVISLYTQFINTITCNSKNIPKFTW